MSRFTPEELDRRMAKADRAIVALRRATLELKALGRSVFERREKTPEPERGRRRSPTTMTGRLAKALP